MPSWNIYTHEYDVDIRPLLSRRLSQIEAAPILTPIEGGVRVTLRSAAAAEQIADAVARLLCRDVQYFALAKMADTLPLDLEEKQVVLTEALRSARAQEDITPLEQTLRAYLSTTRELCIEGFMQFRMQGFLLLWRLCIEEAAFSVLSSKEYRELMRVLGEYVGKRRPRIAELQLCLHADGSCTLTDDSEVRIEYIDCSPDGIVQLLVNMSPQKLIVYDLSDGKNRLVDTLTRVFSGRIKVYK